MRQEKGMLVNRNRFGSCLIAVCVFGLSACSDDDKTSDQGAVPGTTEEPAALLARSAVNNGFYLSQIEEFDSEGRSIATTSYTLNSSDKKLEGRILYGDRLAEFIYTYNEKGDITSINSYVSEDQSTAVRNEVIRIDVERDNGALSVVDVDYLSDVEGEEDSRITYSYGSSGQISSISTQFLESNRNEFKQFNYTNGVLVSIVGDDIEYPDVTVTETIARDQLGRVNLVQVSYDPAQPFVIDTRTEYIYDQNGNISEIQYQTEDGSISTREVNTYVATEEAVFNLLNYNVYFTQ